MFTTSRIRTATAVAGAALIAGPLAVAAAGPAAADRGDIERHGTCAGAPFEFSVDREDRGFEVSLDIDDAAPRSAWTIALRHDGKRYFKRTLRAELDGDVEVERYRRNTRGSDTFKVRIKNRATGQVCKARIRTR